MQNLSKDLYNDLIKNKIFKGYEANISRYYDNLIKLFYVFPSERTSYSSISDIHLNKRKKLERILDIRYFNKHNLIYPIDLYNVYYQFAAYTIPDRRDFIPIYDAKLDLDQKIIVLKKFRRILEYFHSNNIIYGDIKGSNMLVNKNLDVCFCDIDNVSIDELDFDVMSRCLSYFYRCYGDISYKMDSFMFNMFTLEYLLEIYSPNYEDVFDFLDLGQVVLFPNCTDKVMVKKIFHDIRNISDNYGGEYIIDYVK